MGQGLRQAERLGITLETDEVIGIEKEKNFIVETRNKTYEAKTVILATGTNRNTPKIAGIKEFEGKGVSYCAICDAFFYRNKNVAVIGAGDYAIKEAKTLANVAKCVTILTNGDELVENRDEDLDEFIIEDRGIKEISGNEKVENIILKDGKNIETEGVFVAIRNSFKYRFCKKVRSNYRK